ncbi:MAG: glycosyltransferase family 2 protein [Gammaproteobacteria bacterium]|nr:glycosyltransferase family 2 protein [Gammaproteobacteria bacterium]MBU2676239.1 glycosyltransferase family 2 protein [Gammaproteobacteria bacterium]NNC55926.1 glycosyltransferase family 2 protein [Woeseiaceae bacterium]NNL49975.1 glycosyltransferase family 2 protein [Woeseiaceae bacterium]
MSTGNQDPLVTIGMPIYNEERFLQHALDSLLAQDYENIQILISDNASTDCSGDIGRKAAEDDSRIIYTCTEENIGATGNFRRVASMAEGKYFMWAAGHDEWSSDLISASVAALEINSSASIAFAHSRWMGETGEDDGGDIDYPDTRGKSLLGRFFTVFWGSMHPVLSLMRMDYLRQTRSMQGFAGADLVLLLDMVLMGDFVHVPNAWWRRRNVRSKESHRQRMKRYTGAEFGQAKSTLDRRFPLLRLPASLMATIWNSRHSLLQRIILLLALLPLMPVRYIVGVRKANKNSQQ